MNITIDENNHIFSISVKDMTYAFYVSPEGMLLHLYWGGRIDSVADFSNALQDLGRTYPDAFEYHRRMEYRTQEACETGELALDAHFIDGVRGVRLRYTGHKVLKTANTQTLVVFLTDKAYSLDVELNYTIYAGQNFLSRNSVIKNKGNHPVSLTNLKSCTLNLPHTENYRLMHFGGGVMSEYQKQFTQISNCQVVLGNRAGTASGHNCVPFAALDEGSATETLGRVWYGVLHWSGNFKIVVEKSNRGNVTLTAGIHEYDTAWNLKSGESFETPLFTIGYSNNGYEKMSEALYDWQFDYLLPRETVNEVRPIIYNTWYPYEQDIDEKKVLDLVKPAADIGAELFVIDDGWMERDSDSKTGCGNWYPCPIRFPHGLKHISETVHKNNMKFGLWIEPETVSLSSIIYKEHPEWVMYYPTREKTERIGRLLLNLARNDVKDYIFDLVDDLITENELDYLKWDMNRSISEAGWPEVLKEEQQSIYIRYINNLYEIWKRIKEKHRYLLLENSATGGARADYGILPYFDRINRSDNSDPVDVMRLHEGYTTLFLPKLAGGAGNITSEHSLVNQRTIPLKFRAESGMTGSMSIGINLLTAKPTEITELKIYISRFKNLRRDLHNSYVYRLVSSYDCNYSVLQYVTRDRTSSTLFIFCHGDHFAYAKRSRLPMVRLRGLIADADYQLEDGSTLSGKYLMEVGILLRGIVGDYSSCVINIQSV